MSKPTFVFMMATLCACGSDDTSSVSATTQLANAKAYIGTTGVALQSSASALHDSTPAAPFVDTDPVADTLRRSWLTMRAEYCKLEGALDTLAPDVAALDHVYEDDVRETRDDNPYDTTGFSGLHGIERILWAQRTAPYVDAYEERYLGYDKAKLAEQQQQADDFKNQMNASMRQRLNEAVIAMAQGVIQAGTMQTMIGAGMARQYAKVAINEQGKDISRYSQTTLADMRNNLEGTRAIYATFAAKLSAEATTTIAARFDAIDAMYRAIGGDALPPVPQGWDASHPGSDSFSQLYVLLKHETDTANADSLVSLINAAFRAYIASSS